MAGYTLSAVAGVLKRDIERASGYVRNSEWYELRVSPTCPPSKQVNMHGGRTFLSYNWADAAYDDFEYRAYTVPDLTADLSDPDSVFTAVTFTTAHYYQFFVLELRTPSVVEEPTKNDWSFYLHGTGDEFEMAGEAEQSINAEVFRQSGVWDHGVDGCAYPLCGVVLRNDGYVGATGAFLPIDVINRGGSYIWPRDLRPRLPIYQ